MKTLVLSRTSAKQTAIRFHECLFCTSGKSPVWLKTNTPFTTTEEGSLKVKDTYECVDHPGVFAAGDCCHIVDHPRPKGMY